MIHVPIIYVYEHRFVHAQIRIRNVLNMKQALPVNTHDSNTSYLCMSEILVNLVYVFIHKMPFELFSRTLCASITYIYLKIHQEICLAASQHANKLS